MIKRERLKEMIKNNEKIYIVSNLKLSEQGELSSTSNRYIQDYAGLDFATDLIKSISNFSECYFETKEQAEWNLKFGDITRSETLSLPTWEDVKSEKFYMIKFTLANNTRTFGMLRIVGGWLSKEKQHGVIYIETGIRGKLDDCLFVKPLTKENYIEACLLARSLFLGEKNATAD